MSFLTEHTALMGAQCFRAPPYVVSDEDCKVIKESCNLNELAQQILESGPPFNEREIEVLTEAAGNMDDDHDFQRDGHQWRDDVLENYAKYIQNYKYTYKPEAQQLDSSIDPNEEHIGPMAQDIEKVNPAAIKETPEGVKTVDTGRLALMNAGAIAQLAREVEELKNG
jgi:hypothetical protein